MQMAENEGRKRGAKIIVKAADNLTTAYELRKSDRSVLTKSDRIIPRAPLKKTTKCWKDCVLCGQPYHKRTCECRGDA